MSGAPWRGGTLWYRFWTGSQARLSNGGDVSTFNLALPLYHDPTCVYSHWPQREHSPPLASIVSLTFIGGGEPVGPYHGEIEELHGFPQLKGCVDAVNPEGGCVCF